MEWQIMNCGGLNSLVIGTWVDGQYQVSDDCIETLSSILDQLRMEEQMTRRQLAAYHVIQKDLVPLLTELDDDPEIFSLAVKLLVNLTQPIEYMQLVYSSDKVKSLGPRPQFWEIGKMLLDAKTNCTGPKFAWALMREVKKIIMDTGQYEMEDRDCETINQCLLLVRNLLYIQDTVGGDGLSPTHLTFLKTLFQLGIDNILIFVLNAKQKDYWGATVVQVLSLLYRDLVGEIFLRFDNASKCWDEPCDSSCCSACEAAMDRVSILEPYLKTATYKSSRSSSKSQTECSKCEDRSSPEQRSNSEEGSMQVVPVREVSGSPVSTSSFNRMCTTMSEEEMKNWRNGKVKVYKEENSDDRVSNISSNDRETIQSDETDYSVVEELGTCLIDFTSRFIQNGFSNLVTVLKSLLMKSKEGQQGRLDDSYFLWSISFFLKFARRKELNIEFKNIKDVFTADVVGFLVYKAFSNGEDVFLLQKKKMANSLSMKRLHLCVSALRELFKTLSHLLEKGVSPEDKEYLNSFQKDLANMSDLRQLFLWLIRQYDSEYLSLQFLQDTIITNHYFLLLLEVWLEQKLCTDTNVSMLEHISQFATPSVMKNYGYLLRFFAKNDHHVNNCVFTMMHHVAGDCQQPDALLHVNILNTFLQIWDSNYPVTQVMNDLMEYVIQKFISKAEKAPLDLALQLFVDAEEEEAMTEEDPDKMDEGNWTAEEEDKLVMWYSELEDDPDFVEKIIVFFDEMGIRKSKVEIVNKLYEANWLGNEEVEKVIKFDRDLQNIQDGDEVEDDSDQTLQLLSELFKIEEGEKLSPMDLSSMEEDKVISCLLDKIQRHGLSKQLKFLQKSLLEAAYVKLDSGQFDKRRIEEPIMKHCVDMGQPIPLALFSDDQEVICDNLYMQLLLQHLGIYFGGNTHATYPRIPKEWTAADLTEKAALLGEINPEDVKFELSQMMTQGSTPHHNSSSSRKNILNGIKV